MENKTDLNVPFQYGESTFSVRSQLSQEKSQPSQAV